MSSGTWCSPCCAAPRRMGRVVRLHKGRSCIAHCREAHAGTPQEGMGQGRGTQQRGQRIWIGVFHDSGRTRVEQGPKGTGGRGGAGQGQGFPDLSGGERVGCWAGVANRTPRQGDGRPITETAAAANPQAGDNNPVMKRNAEGRQRADAYRAQRNRRAMSNDQLMKTLSGR